MCRCTLAACAAGKACWHARLLHTRRKLEVQAELKVAGECKLVKFWASMWPVRGLGIAQTAPCSSPARMALPSAVSGFIQAVTLAHCRETSWLPPKK